MRLFRLFKRSTVPDEIAENEIGFFVDEDGILKSVDSDGNVIVLGGGIKLNTNNAGNYLEIELSGDTYPDGNPYSFWLKINSLDAYTELGDSVEYVIKRGDKYFIFVDSSDIVNIGGDGVVINPDYVKMTNLPISNPGGSGRLWNDNGTLKIT